MRRESKKRAKSRRVTDPLRKAYVEEAQRCQGDNCPRAAIQCHEICCGTGRRPKAVLYRETWLALCQMCHDAMADYNLWPPAKQCALKLLRDPLHFDLAVIAEVRGDNLVTMDEVVKFLEIKRW